MTSNTPVVSKEKNNLLAFVFDNEFITKPRLKNEFELLLNKALDEYSQQMSIAFAEWVDGEGYECFLHTDENEKHWHKYGDGNFTTKQLYQTFLNTL